MHKRIMILIAALIIPILLIGMGCDKDDSTTGNNDSQLQQRDSTVVSDLFEEKLFATPEQSLEIASALIETEYTRKGKETPGFFMKLDQPEEQVNINSIASVDYSNGWFIFEFNATVINNVKGDTVNIDGIDSIQILVSGQPVEIIVNGLNPDGLKIHDHLHFDTRPVVVNGAYNRSIDLDLETMNNDTLLTINGAAHDTLSGIDNLPESDCDIEISYDLVIDDLVVSSAAADDDCPLNGSLEAVASISAECVSRDEANPDSVSIGGSWRINAEVNDDNTVTITYRGPIVRWTVVEPCDNGARTANGPWALVNR